MGMRRQAREAALQALFMVDFQNSWEEAAVIFCFDHFNVPQNVREYAELLALGVIKNHVKIDSEVTRASENWSVSRMARVDRTIIRVATFEMICLSDVPCNVAINEAIEIAKRFGADESPVFVNGVLDRIATNVRRKIEIERTPKSDDILTSSIEALTEKSVADSDDLPIAVGDGRLK
jgi:transcription antitermination protein NusB